MKPLYYFIVLISSIMFFSCSNNDDSNPTPSQAAISGSVILYDESTTLTDKSNMTVAVMGTNPLIQNTNDTDGTFELPNVPFGTYTPN
jgi:hypothetical protein